MAAVLSKRQMTEEDIKLQFITPAITKKWALSLITMETRITDGQINLRGNMVSRKEAKKADYILYLNESTPIAIVEAKDNKHAVGDGLQQAMQYAIMMDIPFAYSSNGDGFMEHDFLTGEERSISMEDFPAPDALYARFKAGANHGEGLTHSKRNPSFGSRSIQGRIHIPLAIISVTLSIGLLMRLPEVKIASCW